MLHDLRFQVLGPVRATRGEVDLRVGPPQQQAVLTVLLITEGHTASAAKLVEGVWGDSPPQRAVGALRNYVHGLRRALDPAVLRSTGTGYTLDIAPDALDANVFDRRVTEARKRRDDGAVGEASDLLREALALHRGEPLAGIPGPYARAQRSRLAEQRLAVLEDRIDLDLLAGRAAEVAAELAELVTAHPLRERLLAQRMIALHRCGQRTAALEAFAEGRRRLMAELDVEPGPELHELRRRILAGEDIEHPPERRPHRVAGTRPPRPAQLPARIADFTGRVAIATAISTSLLGGSGSAVPISAISGLGGVGKTTLAVHVAHEVRDRFPDGQLYVDLYGVDEEPAAPEIVLKSFLAALGVPDHAVPEGLDERSALLRSVLAGRRVLIVLDNAHSARQVTPLLPGAGGCAVLITSRAKLTSLPGVRTFELDVFEPEEALTLLRKVAGARAEVSGPAARQVVDACGHLPLAVRISASRLMSRPNWTLPLVAERLADQRSRLDELRSGDLAVASTFQLGYDQLEPELARAFRLLSVSGLHGFSRYSAAAMLDRSPAEAERLCEDLVDVSLLQSAGSGRYQYHDLVRLFASDHAMENGQPADRVDALTRLLDFHLTVALTTIACGLNHDAIPLSLVEVAYTGMPLADMSSMRTWLTTAPPQEHPPAADALYRLVQKVELASIAGLDTVAGRLLCAATGTAGTDRDEPVPTAAFPGAPPLLTPERLTALDTGLARVRARWEPGDERTAAQIGFVAAASATMHGNLDTAVSGYRDVLDRCRAIGDVRGEVLATAGLGRTLAMLGRFAEGNTATEDARRLSRDHGDRNAEAFAVHALGQVANLSGDEERAAEAKADTVRLWFATKQPVPGETSWLPTGTFDWSDPKTGVGAWLGVLGHALADLDRIEQARACWRQAVTLLAGLGHPYTAELQSLLHFG